MRLLHYYDGRSAIARPVITGRFAYYTNRSISDFRLAIVDARMHGGILASVSRRRARPRRRRGACWR